MKILHGSSPVLQLFSGPNSRSAKIKLLSRRYKFTGHLVKCYGGWRGSERATICSVVSATDLSKCSVILSSRTSLGRFPTHRCRVSRTIPSPPPVADPSVGPWPPSRCPSPSSHSHLDDERERERRRRRGGGLEGHHVITLVDSGLLPARTAPRNDSLLHIDFDVVDRHRTLPHLSI